MPREVLLPAELSCISHYFNIQRLLRNALRRGSDKCDRAPTYNPDLPQPEATPTDLLLRPQAKQVSVPAAARSELQSPATAEAHTV